MPKERSHLETKQGAEERLTSSLDTLDSSIRNGTINLLHCFLDCIDGRFLYAGCGGETESGGGGASSRTDQGCRESVEE